MNCNKCVDILVGLNAGSEGKGKFMSILQDIAYAALVRTGGPNAAHTVEYKGKHFAFHTIPCGAFHFPNAKVVLGANAQIDIEHLKHEIEVLKEAGVWSDDRLMVDPNAVIIDPIDKIAENGGRMPDCGDLWTHPIDCSEHVKLGGTCAGCDKLPQDSAWKALGSTTHGVGANACRKAARGTKMVVLPGQKLDLAAYFRKKFGEDINYSGISEEIMKLMEGGPITDWGEFIEPEKVRYSGDDEFLKQFVGGTVEFLNRLIDNDKPILLEGTQGSILSLHHGYRGKTTSRDTNASNWCADAGISPFAVRDVYGVTRTFPIRVAGDSGPMSGQEIKWSEVTEHATEKPIVKWMKQLEELIDMEEAQINRPSLEKLTANADNKDISSLAQDLLDAPYIEEITTATKRKRRVFTLDSPDGKPSDLKKALDINRPTKLMLSFVDYLNYQDRHKSSWDSLTQKTKDWITTLESKLGVFFNYLSTGPDVEHTIFRRSPGELAAAVQSIIQKRHVSVDEV